MIKKPTDAATSVGSCVTLLAEATPNLAVLTRKEDTSVVEWHPTALLVSY